MQMKLKHRPHGLSRRRSAAATARFTASFLYFISGFFIAIVFFPRSIMSPSSKDSSSSDYLTNPALVNSTDPSTVQQQQSLSAGTAPPIIKYIQSPPRTVKVNVRVPVPVYPIDETFVKAWQHSSESCQQWISIQRQTNSYIDAYVVGSQKGATSELSKNLFNLGVRRPEMTKEWHFFNRINAQGDIASTRTIAEPLPPLEIPDLRLLHYASGFQHSNITNDTSIPLVDASPKESRQLVLDMTVEYLHSDRSAFLAYMLTPHAKVIITIRNPMDRALSQYNMNIRNGNKIRRRLNVPDRAATPEEFDQKVRAEISKLKLCGYDEQTAKLDRKTSQLVACMFTKKKNERFDDALYVTRGLYHLHIRTWRDYFPDHRILVVSFEDISLGKRQVYQSLTEFLCVRSYPDSWLDSFEKQGSLLSFGQIAAKKGLDKGGFDSYKGNDRYLPEMLPETEQMLRKFYEPADKQLRAMLGPHYVYWST